MWPCLLLKVFGFSGRLYPRKLHGDFILVVSVRERMKIPMSFSKAPA
jgi:hypothetical protein